MKPEIWKPIPTYEGLYEASSYGRIRSCTRYVTSNRATRNVKGIMLKLKNLKKQSTLFVQLSDKDDKKIHYPVALLVATAFGILPPSILHRHIDYLDGNPENCAPENLVWVRERRGPQKQQKESPKPSEKITLPSRSRNNKIVQLTLTGELIAVHESSEAAAKAINIKHKTSITRCCRGEVSNYKGFKWLYKEDYDLYLLHQKDEEQG